MRYTIQDIMSNGTIILTGDDNAGLIVSWYPRSSTFNLWHQFGHSDEWENVDCCTRYDVETVKLAWEVANIWLSEIWDERSAS